MVPLVYNFAAEVDENSTVGESVGTSEDSSVVAKGCRSDDEMYLKAAGGRRDSNRVQGRAGPTSPHLLVFVRK